MRYYRKTSDYTSKDGTHRTQTYERNELMDSAMLHVGDALPNGHFESLYIRELPDGHFELVMQRMSFVGDDHTISEDVIAIGTIIEIMRAHALGATPAPK